VNIAHLPPLAKLSASLMVASQNIDYDLGNLTIRQTVMSQQQALEQQNQSNPVKQAKQSKPTSAQSDNTSQTQQLSQLKSAIQNSQVSQQQASRQNQISNSPVAQAQRQQINALSVDVVQKQENKTGLPDNLKSGMENLSGMSLDSVKVHYNSAKPAAVQAHAYAQGTDIHLGSGQEKHLPHELGHVVQQAQGRVKPTTSVGGMAVNDNPGLESEATRMGDVALQKAAIKE
jgi:hypothetical protein